VDRLVGMPDRRRLEELIARAKGLTG
jgi:hypothetical protein